MSVDKLIDFKNGDLPMGKGIGVSTFDKHLVYKPNRFVSIVGRPNVGKTFYMLWYFYVLSKKYKVKWDIYSTENETWILKMYLLEFHYQKNVKNIDDKDIFDFDNWLSIYFNFIENGNYTLDELFKIGNNDNIFIDPYNSLNKPSGNSHDYDYYCIRLIQEHKKKRGVWINHHPFTEAQRRVIRDKNDEFNGYPDFMKYYDVEGGGKWFNASDLWLSIHRFVTHPQDYKNTKVLVEKEKVTQTGGCVTSEGSYIVNEYKNNRFFIGGQDPLNENDPFNFDNAEQIII